MTTNSVSKERLAELASIYKTVPFRNAEDDDLYLALTELLSLRTSSGGVTSGEVVTDEMVGWRKSLLAMERFSQFTDGWGDEVFGLKQHAAGDYVKWSDILHVLREIPETAALSSLHAQPEGAEPKTGIEVTGFYRRCSADTPGAEWAEGIGYHVHDEQARIEGQAAAGITRGKQEPQGTGSREAVAWLHNLTGVIRQDKPAAAMGLYEDYTHLFPLSQLQAVERERDEALDELSAAWSKHGGMEIAKGQWQARAETAEASLSAAREALKSIEDLPKHSREDDGENASQMATIARAALAGSNPK